MSESCQALRVGVEEDLLPLSVLLHKHNVRHRIFEEGGYQVVEVSQQEQAQQVKELYRAWRAGEVRIELSRQQPEVSAQAAAPAVWHAVPVTVGLIVLSICGFLLIYLNAPMSWLSSVSFTPFEPTGGQISFQEVDGQYWRLITPVFLHFGWLHIVFNSLWMWELGGRVERVMGHFNMFMLFLVIAVVSNVCQYVFGGVGLFGGMSGVVYGLLGFSWMAPLLQSAWAIQPPKGIMLFMVGWLVVCMSGMIEVLGFGAIANAAHLGGLICGGVLGVLFGGLSRLSGDNAGSSQV